MLIANGQFWWVAVVAIHFPTSEPVGSQATVADGWLESWLMISGLTPMSTAIQARFTNGFDGSSNILALNMAKDMAEWQKITMIKPDHGCVKSSQILAPVSFSTGVIDRSGSRMWALLLPDGELSEIGDAIVTAQNGE